MIVPRSLGLLVTLVVLASSCSLLLPANPNSNAREGEQVSITLFAVDDTRSTAQTNRAQYGADYQKEFGIPIPTAPLPPAGGAAAAVPLSLPSAIDTAAGFALDFVAAQLKQEATEYEAQFKTTAAGDKFWILGQADPVTTTTTTSDQKTVTTIQGTAKTIADSKANRFTLKSPITRSTQLSEETVNTTEFTGLLQNYWGFNIKRTVKVGNTDTEAFNLVVGIAPSVDQQMFRMAPLSFREQYSKAKVLSDQWFTWLEIWTLPGKIIKTPGHTLDSTTTATITAYWIDKTQQLQVKQVAGFNIPIAGYNIDQNPTLTPGAGLPLGQTSAWLPAIPVSMNAEGKAIGRGTFTISALVDDKDASNTQQYLEQASDLITTEKPTLLQLIPGSQPTTTSSASGSK